ncbi:3-dehydroquinate synthase [Clostridium fallax]|uniref:3-dehydroquinate synthase n=1 Tax=Clostridium fallax TaxID=1533 RepID=A0A1M4YIG9_9CLOT|nr:3-dehydroquinate synthase [Clostridium fallax]SHF05557.1 3-dehydroquinate synthase [Clostridium fallax]SQB06313.1 3-dehydroquinate synthase [Clostridium fallax]
MNIIEVTNKNEDYKIYITNKKEKIIDILKNYISLKNNSYVIIDKNVYENHMKSLSNMAKEISSNKILVLSIDEKRKNYSTIEKIYKFLIDNNCKREGILISIGGGVLGDLVGMAASTYMRGIKYINIPTTVISQSDSSIGGKVGYNFDNIKNAIGAFYNPSMAVINVNFLNTLKDEQYINGLGEIIKYSFLDNKHNLLEYLVENREKIKNRDEDILSNILKICLLIKKDYVQKDFKDGGIRNSLNLGHTIGHGIEVIKNYEILHGEAVALGLLCALKLSSKKFGLSLEFYYKAKELMEYFNLKTSIDFKDFNILIEKIKKDKKNDNKIRFVLLKNIGEPIVKVSITEEEIVDVIKETIKENE